MYWRIGAALGLLILGIVVGRYVFPAGNDTPSHSVRLSDSSHPLISPLLLCSTTPLPQNQDTTMQRVLEDYVTGALENSRATDMSVYFINFKTGLWAGVNTNAKYEPASLLKVPLMMAYLNWIEQTPSVATQEFSYNGTDQNTNEHFRSSNNILPGVNYTTTDLLKSMIINSDNTAELMLENAIDPAQLGHIYTDLGLSVLSGQATTTASISVLQYAYFFRVLYSSTYLTREDSEQALDYLSQAHFTQGIAGAIPDGVTVAQKFGERTHITGTRTTDEELHDCGIIYKPNSPYLLCIMSRGINLDTLTANIKGLSAVVYSSIK